MQNRFWFIFGLWSLYGLFNTAVVHYRSILYGKDMSWRDAALYEMSFAWIWAAITPAILVLSRKFPVGRGQSRRNVFVHFLAAVVAAVATKAVWDFSALPIVAPSMVPTNGIEMAKSVLRALDFGTLHYLIVAICHHTFEYYRRYEDGRLRASQLEAKLATAQLAALKMQLHPHFLFNTLHSISELVHADPRRAETMIVRLSDFLRLTLEHVGIPEVPLAEELDFLRRYLEIEQMRFEERLSVEWNIDPEVIGVRVPNLILQPIVENALKHGISRNPGPGIIRITCRRDGDRLAMHIYDNGPGPQRQELDLTQPVREGVGLNNTRSRLTRIYGGDHRIDLHRVPEGGFEVTLRVPLRLTTRPVEGREPIPEPAQAAGD